MADRSEYFYGLFNNPKYRPIFVSLIILTIVLASILFANYQFAKRATIATEQMDLIGNISDNTLLIATGTQQLDKLMQSNPEEGKKVLEGLKAQAQEINDYMAELKIYKQQEQAMIKFAELWKTYDNKINTLTPTSSPESFAELASYAYRQQALIWELMNESYDVYLNKNLELANYTRYMQISTFVALLAFLTLFIGYALRRMHDSDILVETAQKETDDIMRTVNEGLFLIDKDLIISEQYSAKLEEVLHQTHIAGRNLYDLLQGIISQKDMETTKLFIEQLYNAWVVEDLIQDLNPLKQVLMSYVDAEGMSDTKFLDFNFLRVLDKEQKTIEKVFVSVVDVTKEVRLQLQMQKDREQHDRQIEMISSLLSVNKAQLGRFIQETKHRITRMNDVLRQDKDNLHDKVKQLFREVHSLKGDASAIKLSSVVAIANNQENHLKRLSEYTDLKGNDFLGFTIGLNELMDMMKFIEDLSIQLNFQGENHSTPKSEPTTKPVMMISPNIQTSREPTIAKQPIAKNTYNWQDYFSNYAHDIANRQSKKVNVVVVGFEGLDPDDHKAHLYKDIATQFLKNAIVHGIERPADRLAKGKNEIGQIILSIEKTGNDHEKLSIHDDGQGINWQKIRQKAIDMGQITQEQAKQLQARDLVRLLLSSGLSTAETQDEDAGRGVGMDIVRQLAVEGKGKLGINSQPNLFTQMNVTFPVS